MVCTVLSQNKLRKYSVPILVYSNIAFQKKKSHTCKHNKLKTVLSCSIAQSFSSCTGKKRIYIGLVRYVYICKNKSWNKNIRAY